MGLRHWLEKGTECLCHGMRGMGPFHSSSQESWVRHRSLPSYQVLAGPLRMFPAGLGEGWTKEERALIWSTPSLFKTLLPASNHSVCFKHPSFLSYTLLSQLFCLYSIPIAALWQHQTLGQIHQGRGCTYLPPRGLGGQALQWHTWQRSSCWLHHQVARYTHKVPHKGLCPRENTAWHSGLPSTCKLGVGSIVRQVNHLMPGSTPYVTTMLHFLQSIKLSIQSFCVSCLMWTPFPHLRCPSLLLGPWSMYT